MTLTAEPSTDTRTHTQDDVAPQHGGPVLTAPKRRNVPALREAVASVEVGDEVEAVFRDERYGLHAIRGTLCKTKTLEGLVLAGIAIAPKDRPIATLVSLVGLTDGAATDTGTDTGDVVREEPGEPMDPATAIHGDLVTAVFECDPWGRFTATGHAVSLNDHAVMVGGWFLNTDHHLSTIPGVRVRSARRLPDDASTGSRPERALTSTDG